MIKITYATDPKIKHVKYAVTVLSEKIPQYSAGLQLRGSGSSGFFLKFFKGQWMPIKDADDTVSGLLRFENLTSHRVFIGNNGQSS